MTKDFLAINTARFLSVDAIQKANSGHPGLPMGAAPTAFTLWAKEMKHNPKNPNWKNRDVFVNNKLYSCMYVHMSIGK